MLYGSSKKKDFQEWDRDFTGLDLITDLHLFAPLIFLFVAIFFLFLHIKKASEFQNRAINHPDEDKEAKKAHTTLHYRYYSIQTGLSSIKRMAFLYLTRKLIQDETSEL